jgi:hypothetical protein
MRESHTSYAPGGSHLSIPGSQYGRQSDIRSSPLKPSQAVTRSILEKSASKEPPRSPSRGGVYSSPVRGGSNYGAKQRDSPLR